MIGTDKVYTLKVVFCANVQARSEDDAILEFLDHIDDIIHDNVEVEADEAASTFVGAVDYYVDYKARQHEGDEDEEITVEEPSQESLGQAEMQPTTHIIKGQVRGNNHAIQVDGVALQLGPSLKIQSHSPDGFEWGYGGSGPAQAALAILQFLQEGDWQ
jgi:hypothetical protein